MNKTQSGECSKLVLKENLTKNDWVRKVIHWELCKGLNFDHSTKWYVHKLESVLGREKFYGNLRYKRIT